MGRFDQASSQTILYDALAPVLQFGHYKLNQSLMLGYMCDTELCPLEAIEEEIPNV